jgi:hypothetical protein
VAVRRWQWLGVSVTLAVAARQWQCGSGSAAVAVVARPNQKKRKRSKRKSIFLCFIVYLGYFIPFSTNFRALLTIFGHFSAIFRSKSTIF